MQTVRLADPLLRSACAGETHEALKADDAAWSLLRFRGIQHDLPGYPSLELRDCPCGSTLARKLPMGVNAYTETGLDH